MNTVIPEKEVTLLVYGNDEYRGQLPCTARSAYGDPGSEDAKDEGLIHKIYRLGKKELPDKQLLVAARPEQDGGKYTFFTPEGSIIADPAKYARTGRNW